MMVGKINLRRDRTKRYEIILDCLPRWSVILILVLVLLLVGILVVVSLFASPTASINLTRRHSNDITNQTVVGNITLTRDVFTGTQPIVDIFEDISVYSMEFKYTVKFNPIDKGNNTFAGILKDDLLMRGYLYGRNSKDEEWTLINTRKEDENITRSLACTQVGYIGPISYSGCWPTTVFYSRVIRYSQYKTELYILNLENVHKAGLLEDVIETSFVANNPNYTSYELGFRMTFSVLALIHWIVFVVVVAWSQQWSSWHTTQKWLIVLLFLHIWYHEPLYPAMMHTGWEGFPIVNIILSVSFVYGFLFYLLVFFHSVFKAPQHRTFMNFYFTKIVIVGIAYILTLILMIWSRVFNVANPSSVDISSIPGYVYLVAANVVFLVLWGIDLAYYIFRSMGAVGKMKQKYSGRFRVIGCFSFIVAACFISVTITANGFRTDIQSLTFLLLHGIVYVYFACLSVLLLPGPREEKKPEPRTVTIDPTQSDNTKTDVNSAKANSPRDNAEDDEVQITDVVLSRNDEDEHV
ncbi:hypothetical protein C9374_014135 [Naegleria lovaniensis]|uniref:Wntless-like transmembrane domain-containing protein n=1 Tax=Naegleria lovaniensis TaxID=51637 RepID=A0AA88KN21_NAELO|nr:uncharacterized protein C9374_014135 [Naegleria lovaniensis]KAG2389575.1 hypothetical protein C9374_014135 [Naegleria lovaniensis]